ncbi:LysR family transcriptional regulator [Pilimelia anulata]|uniref:LysR family transcriptional regulator n=1 Tax=Pilimelia anulata TaxID=53371 RepID=A0A8J3FF87_9ACTN|nr:LysR family transcriptional regulator [Pilimelia anulata]GGK03644.1 LysR family transcriptional regulator [Pilimelia anulata]
MELELRHLRTVCAIAETGSLTKAAASMRMSQPALTARLKRLEAEIGAPLFVRGARGMIPTPVGDYVLLRARGILHGVAELRGGVARQGRGPAPVIALGGAASSVSLGLADRLTAHLGAEVRLTMADSPLLLRDLVAAGRFDLVATVDYPGYELHPTPELHCVTITREPVAVALAAGDPLARHGSVALADLADRDWAMTPSDGAGWPECFLAACEQHGFRPRVRYTVPGSDTIRELVAAGRAVSACQIACYSDGPVVVRPLIGEPVSMRHLLICPREGRLAGELPTLARLARASYRSYVHDRHTRANQPGR